MFESPPPHVLRSRALGVDRRKLDDVSAISLRPVDHAAVVSSFLFAHSSSASRGSSAFDACLRARIGSFFPALVAFAATPRLDNGVIIWALIVRNICLCPDGFFAACDDLASYC